MAWTVPATFATNESPLTSTKLNTHLRDNMRELWHEVAYVEFTSDVTTTTATEAAPLDVVSSGAITYAAYPILVEVYSPYWLLNGAGGVSLWDDATDLGRLWDGIAGNGAALLCRRLTPTAASHTYKARIWQTGGSTSTANAGAGGAGVTLPGYIRILQKGGA
jgi:hypothetical protein